MLSLQIYKSTNLQIYKSTNLYIYQSIHLPIYTSTNCPLKGAQGDAVYILSALKVFLKRMKQKRPLKVHPPNAGRGTFILFNSIDCGRLSFQPISEYRNRTTTLIPFLQAINHFCNFIPSYFMERFAFLMVYTSYSLVAV